MPIPADWNNRRVNRPWHLLLCLLPFVYIASVLAPPPLGLGLQHANDFQACRIWWKLLGTLCLRDGFFPLWNHFQDYGSVYPGYTGYGALYPFTFWLHPLFALEIPAVQTYSEYLSIGLHAAWGLNGAFLWMRRSAGVSAPAAALGASLLLVNQRFNDFIRYPNALEAASWLPWILLLFALLLDPAAAADTRRRWVLTLCAAFCTAMAWLAGYGQLTYIFFLLAGVVLLAHVDRSHRWLWPAGALALGTLAAAGTLFPTALHALHSPERGGGALAFATNHPLLVGYARMFTHPFHADVHASAFFAAAFLPLMALGLHAARRADWRWAVGLGAAALVIADLSLGEQGLLFPFFHAHVPMYGSFRVQGRNNTITLLALAWFAALGFDAARASPPLRRAVAGAMLALAVALALATGWTFAAGDASAMKIFGMTAGQAVRSHRIWLGASTAALLVVLLARNDRWARVALLAGVWFFVLTFARWTTDYRSWPTGARVPHYERGVLTPHRVGIGTVNSPLLEELYGPVQAELDRLGRRPTFPGSRFLFSPDEAGHPPPRLALESMGPNHFTARIDSPVAGRLLFMQAWHAGWRSSLPLRPATGALAPLSVVEVPAGSHRLELRFRPAGIMASVLVSVLAPAGLAAAALVLAGRRRTGAGVAVLGAVATALALAGMLTTHPWPDAFLMGERGQTREAGGEVPVVAPGQWQAGAE